MIGMPKDIIASGQASVESDREKEQQDRITKEVLSDERKTVSHHFNLMVTKTIVFDDTQSEVGADSKADTKIKTKKSKRNFFCSCFGRGDANT